MEPKSKIRRIDIEDTKLVSGHPSPSPAPPSILLRKLPYHLRLSVLELSPIRCNLFGVVYSISEDLPNTPSLPLPFEILKFTISSSQFGTDVVTDPYASDDILASDHFPSQNYIQSLFGYFVEDFTRKPFLVVKCFTVMFLFPMFRLQPSDLFLLLRLPMFRRRWCPRKPLSHLSLDPCMFSPYDFGVNSGIPSFDDAFSPHDVDNAEPPIQTKTFQYMDPTLPSSTTPLTTKLSAIERTFDRRFLETARIRTRSFSPLIDFLLFRCPFLTELSIEEFDPSLYDGPLTQDNTSRHRSLLGEEALTCPARLARVRLVECKDGDHFYERFAEVTNLHESLQELWVHDCQVPLRILKGLVIRPSHILTHIDFGISISMTVDLLGRENCSIGDICPQLRSLSINPVAENDFDQLLSNLVHLYPNLEYLNFQSVSPASLDRYPSITLSRAQQLASFQNLKGFGCWPEPLSTEEFVPVLRCLGDLGLLRIGFAIDSKQLDDLSTHFALFFGSSLRTFDFYGMKDFDSVTQGTTLKEFIRTIIPFLSVFSFFVEVGFQEEMGDFVTTLIEEEKPDLLTVVCLDEKALYYRVWDEE